MPYNRNLVEEIARDAVRRLREILARGECWNGITISCMYDAAIAHGAAEEVPGDKPNSKIHRPKKGYNRIMRAVWKRIFELKPFTRATDGEGEGN
jgi:hypothetical protein